MAFHSLLGGVALAAAVAVAGAEHSGLVGLGTALVIILRKPLAVAILMGQFGAVGLGEERQSSFGSVARLPFQGCDGSLACRTEVQLVGSETD